MNRFYRLVGILVSPCKIFHVVTVIPRLCVEDQRKLIDLEFLIFWGMRILMSPLLERDISADKLN
jgi:hypothetical protein